MAELVSATDCGDGTDSARRRAPALATADSSDCVAAGDGSATDGAACGLAVA